MKKQKVLTASVAGLFLAAATAFAGDTVPTKPVLEAPKILRIEPVKPAPSKSAEPCPAPVTRRISCDSKGVCTSCGM